MIERESIQAQIPLFDEIPQVLKKKEGDIMKTFDGSLGSRGIEITINPKTGEIIRGRFFDLLSGKITTYEPLTRGKWCSPISDLRVGSPEYEKLDVVSQDVKDKFMLWKVANPHHLPIREWTTVKGKRYENPGVPKIILPAEWFEKESLSEAPQVSLAEALREPEEEPETEPILGEKPKEKKVYGKPPREKTSHAKRTNIISSIVNSKEEPRIADARPASSALRRKSERDKKRLINDKGSLGARVRRATGKNRN